MTRLQSIIGFFVVVLLMAACGGTKDGTGDNKQCGGVKCDALNKQNDPANLGFTIKYELAEQSMVGVTLRSEFIPYNPPTYYPFTSDGINSRSYDSGKSPAEKYDRLLGLEAGGILLVAEEAVEHL